MLLGAWLFHSVRLAAALGMAIACVQALAATREKSLHASYDRIARDPDLWRPIAAARDALNDDTDARRQIAQTVFESFPPQLDLSFAAAIYGLAGLFPGSLIAELATAAFLSRQHHDMSSVCRVSAVGPTHRCRLTGRPVLFPVG